RHLSNDQNVRSLKKLHARSRARRGSRTHRSIRNAAAVPDGSRASAVPTATASARIIEKNAFMVLIVSLLTDRVRLFSDRTANRRFHLSSARSARPECHGVLCRRLRLRLGDSPPSI